MFFKGCFWVSRGFDLKRCVVFLFTSFLRDETSWQILWSALAMKQIRLDMFDQ